MSSSTNYIVAIQIPFTCHGDANKCTSKEETDIDSETLLFIFQSINQLINILYLTRQKRLIEIEISKNSYSSSHTL